jgi:outer membrane protein assembly factor BamB
MYARWLLTALAAINLASAVALAADSAPVASGDWPGWRGPERTGVSRETGLLHKWPPGGPKLLWKAKGLGGGYSTPSIAAGRLFVMGSRGDDEYLMVLDVKDGHQLWSTRVGRVGENRGPNYPGPRSTPSVDGDLLYTLGSDGDLVCAETATGKIVWQKHLEKDFQGNRHLWAYAESPLIDGDTLVCTPGGATAALVALDKRTGAVRWQTQKEYYNIAGYASAIVAEVGGVKQYIQFLGAGLIGVSAADGKELWFYRGNLGGQSCATPIFHDGCVFSSASGVEGAGGDALLRITVDRGHVRAEQVYRVRTILNHHGGIIRVGDYLYGTSGSALVCMDFKTGAAKWRDRCVGKGSLVVADGHLYVRGERGEVALVEAVPEGYKEKGRFRQPDRSGFPAFCHPVVAGGRLYLRDEDVLLCYDVKEKSSTPPAKE